MPHACLASAWVHDLSPWVVRFSQDWGVRWYGLSYVLAFVISWVLMAALARRGRILIPPERVPDVMIAWMIGVLLGGRLGYVLIYRPELLWTLLPSPPWWGVLSINTGGMASHGGMVGAILASIWIARGRPLPDGSRWARVPALHVIDLSALLVPIGMFLGRLGNFINGELLGRIVAPPGQPGPWWAVKFPHELLEARAASGGLAPDLTPAQQAGLDALIQPFIAVQDITLEPAIARLIDRVQHGGPEWAARLEPFLASRHPSQLYQAAAEGVVLGGALWLIAARRPRPGIVGCWFMIVYGAFRILTEFFRLPDAHLANPYILGLTRGQALSVLMILVGLTALVMLSGGRRKAPAVG